MAKVAQRRFRKSKSKRRIPARKLFENLRQFSQFGKASEFKQIEYENAQGHATQIPAICNEFWTSKQRAAHSLHEISYRACFKPLLPAFFIDRLSRPGDVIFDPFTGRGTTILEAVLRKRRGLGCDINPVSRALIQGRLDPPTLKDIDGRLKKLDLQRERERSEFEEELLTFYHPETLTAILNLREHFLNQGGELDGTDSWLRTVALNRLTGHSSGFFSVYTLPPNQATSIKAQRRINERRNQSPPFRDVKQILLKKSKSLLRDCDPSHRRQVRYYGRESQVFIQDCSSVPQIEPESVDLIITSPPFLDVVDYAQDNWLRAWFLGIDASELEISMLRHVDQWREKMISVLEECRRIQKPGGYLIFEVGEVRGGRIQLDLESARCLDQAGYTVHGLVINQQQFTKTSNCWGITNNKKGTNSNRMLIGQKLVKN